MKHSVFQTDDIYAKYNKNYDSHVDDDLLADIKHLKES